MKIKKEINKHHLIDDKVEEDNRRRVITVPDWLVRQQEYLHSLLE